MDFSFEGFSRPHALPGNAFSEAPPRFLGTCRYEGRMAIDFHKMEGRAFRYAFPRRAWERGSLGNTVPLCVRSPFLTLNASFLQEKLLNDKKIIIQKSGNTLLKV